MEFPHESLHLEGLQIRLHVSGAGQELLSLGLLLILSHARDVFRSYVPGLKTTRILKKSDELRWIRAQQNSFHLWDKLPNYLDFGRVVVDEHNAVQAEI